MGSRNYGAVNIAFLFIDSIQTRTTAQHYVIAPYGRSVSDNSQTNTGNLQNLTVTQLVNSSRDFMEAEASLQISQQSANGPIMRDKFASNMAQPKAKTCSYVSKTK